MYVELGKIRQTDFRKGTHSLRGVWFSPISYPTSYYGTVRFQFAWRRVLRRAPYIYWAGWKQHEKRIHLKFVISDDPGLEQETGGRLRRYHPETTRGPLRCRGREWTYRYAYDFEFFITLRIPLSQSHELAFVPHKERCHRKGVECPEFRVEANSYRAGARILAHVLSRQFESLDRLLDTEDKFALAIEFKNCRDILLADLEDARDEALDQRPGARPVRDLSFALRRYARGEVQSAGRRLIGFTSERLEKSLDTAIAGHFARAE